jgi:hypothetical protein
MADYIEKLDLSEKDVELTKLLYEEHLAKRPEEESELSLEDFTYLIFEFGILNIKIKADLERLIELKNYFDMDSHKEEFILDYLNLDLKDIEEDTEEE